MYTWYVTVTALKKFTGASLYEVSGKIKHPIIDWKSFGEIVGIWKRDEEESSWTVRAIVTTKVKAVDIEEVKRQFYNPNKLSPFEFEGFVKIEKAVEVPEEEWLQDV